MPQFTFCPQCNARYDTAGMPAGKRLRCRTCKAIFNVPGDSASTPAIGAPAAEDGAQDMVVRAPGGQESTRSVAELSGGHHRSGPFQTDAEGQQRSQTAETGVTPVIEALTDASGEEKYAVEDEIARGGMGMILKAVDRDIRRPVAMKVILDEADEHNRARFVEEAQVTGQLEHPNIMPIHELGLDAHGRLFFTMKLVKGRSLEDVLKGLKKHDAATEREYSLGRLLTAFVSVCNAMALAHAKGVVHRDLKPANIMLGDYGEVLVMDWGLAKPGAAYRNPPGLRGGRTATIQENCGTGGTPAVRASDAKLARMVQSLRAETGGSLTADGAIIGTPHYMAPEQADGKIEEIDARSDIYSLGAILYELLTLQTPCVGRTIFMLVTNVSQGRIQPPHERAPERNVPPELAAVAMKALARRKEDRYQRVEDLRRDIELYLEGRAVSAKEDSMWEAIVKLVKRNQGASIATGIAAALLVVVLGVSYWINYEARQRAEASERQARQALADLQAEQRQRQQAEAARRAEQKKSVPAFIGAARTALTQMKYDDALAHLRAALDYDPENTEALLLESQLLICLQDYAGAVAELGKYLALKPDDADAKKLAELAGKATRGDNTYAPAFSEVFSRQKAHYFAASLSQDTDKLRRAYRQRLNEAWPGMNVGGGLTVVADGKLRLDLTQLKQIADLTPLKGMRLSYISLQDSSVRDLSPLRSMPLTRLFAYNCSNLGDLGPLKGMPLADLNLTGCRQVKDLTPLKGMPLTNFILTGAPVIDLAPLAGIPLTTLVLNLCGAVHDFSALKGMKLVHLDLGNTQFADVNLLVGMPLTYLNVGGCPVADLAPLEGMKLTTLCVREGRVSDLTPLKGMPLAYLDMWLSRVTDLTPLEGMSLQTLSLTPQKITKGIEVIRNMKSLTDINRGSPAEFWKKYDAGEFK